MQAFWALTSRRWKGVCHVPIAQSSYSELGAPPLGFGPGVWVSGSSVLGSPFSRACHGSCGAADAAGQMFSLTSGLPPPFI